MLHSDRAGLRALDDLIGHQSDPRLVVPAADSANSTVVDMQMATLMAEGAGFLYRHRRSSCARTRSTDASSLNSSLSEEARHRIDTFQDTESSESTSKARNECELCNAEGKTAQLGFSKQLHGQALSAEGAGRSDLLGMRVRPVRRDSILRV